MVKFTFRLNRARPGHSTTLLSTPHSYYVENQVCSRRILEFPDVAETLQELLQRSNKEQHPQIHYCLQTQLCRNFTLLDPIIPDPNKRDAKLDTRGETDPHYQWRVMPTSSKCIVLYVFCASAPVCHVVINEVTTSHTHGPKL